MPKRCPNPACDAPTEIDAARFCARCGAPFPAPVAPADPLVGQVIADGRYAIESLLGEGGMGRVYLATQRLGTVTRKVAIKMLHAEARGAPGVVDRLQREVALAIQLDHPNIVRVYDSGTLGDGTLFIVMEHVEGVSLSQVIAAGRLPVARAEVVVRQVASGLAHAHEHGIVHRDLKPDNVLLARRGTRGDVVKVVDFGIARQASVETGSFTRAGLILGTPAYMAPEQFAQSDVTASADLYALGVLTYEMLTGTLPYQASTPWAWAIAHGTHTPPPLAAHGPIEGLLPRHASAVARAMGRTPAERFASVIEFAQAFTDDPSAGAGWTEGFSSNQGSARQAFGATPAFAASVRPTSPSLPPTVMSPAYAPTFQAYVGEPSRQAGAPVPAPVLVPQRPARTVLWVVLAAVLAAVMTAFGVVALVEWKEHHNHPEHHGDPHGDHHGDPSVTPPARAAAPTPPPAVVRGVAVAPSRPAVLASETFSSAHRYWTPVGGEMSEGSLAAVVAPAVALRDGRCVPIPPGAVVTLLLPGERAVDRRPRAILRVSLADAAGSGAYDVELGPDHDHLRPVLTNQRGDVELDIDRLGFGSSERPLPLRCARIRVPGPQSGAGVCLDAVEALRVSIDSPESARPRPSQ